jgi:hypothetical protein
VTYFEAATYFLLALSVHVSRRTLIARHSEYHVSLLELSRDPGLGSTALTKRERCVRLSFTLACVSSLANMCAMLINTRNVIADGVALTVLIIMFVETLLNRHTVGAFAFLQSVLFGVFFAGATFALNASGACSSYFRTHPDCGDPVNTAARNTSQWYDLHITCTNTRGSPPASWRPFSIFFGLLMGSCFLVWSTTSLRFWCTDSKEDRSSDLCIQ